MTDEFCSSYLEALKPSPVIIDSTVIHAWKNSNIIDDKENGKRKTEDSGGDSPTFSKKRRGNLPKASTNLLKKWLFDHLVISHLLQNLTTSFILILLKKRSQALLCKLA
jgi:hypothetical protein